MFDSLSWPENLPKEHYLGFMEAVYKQRLKNVRGMRKFHQGVGKFKEEYRKEFYGMIGKDHLKIYKKLHKARIEKLNRHATVTPFSSKKTQEREKLRVQLVADSSKVISRSNVAFKKLEKLRTGCAKKVEKLFNATLGKGVVGKSITRPDNRDYFPPYWYGENEYDHYESDDSLSNPSYSIYQDGRSGDLGSQSRISVRNADEWDLVDMVCRSSFIVGYENPHNGQLAFNLDLEASVLDYSANVRNACGRSSASVRQRGRVYVQLYIFTSLGWEITPRIFSPIDLFCMRWSGREGSWSESVCSAGTDFSHSFVAPYPIPAGRIVLIVLGIQTDNEFLSNDCDISSTVEARVMVRKIGVTTTT